MSSLIIGFARSRPACLQDYLPGSSYLSLRDLLFTEDCREMLRETNPSYMVIFDMDVMTEETKSGVIQYLAMRDEAGSPLPFSLVFMSPTKTQTLGKLPKEGENVNLVPEAS